MLLIDNINILKKDYPNTWDKLKSLEDSIDTDLIKLEETRRGDKTLVVEKDDKKTYLHSKYNPIREAEAIIEEYKDIKEDTTIIFYGTGLGYHIDLFLERHPNINYYIYETIPELLYQYLSNKTIEKLPSRKLKNIMLANDTKETNIFLNNVIDQNKGEIFLIELPVHKKIFSEEYKTFFDLFEKIVKNKRSSLRTNYAFQKRWIINSMKNFGEVLSTPNILMSKKEIFKDKPAVLVAAGPSLNEEIENLRYIKDNGLAYIFSVGSAINTLIHHGIYPDAACTYDPTAHNQKVFETIKEKEIKEIPMIFGSSVGYETLLDYPGDKYHMITSQDTVSKYYLKSEDNKEIDIVQDASSIAVVTMQLLHELDFSPIILVGQNLAYRGKERYSEGIGYYSKEVTEQEMQNGLWVKDVYGNEILTNTGFNNMRQQMEFYISKFSAMNVINTTKGGANIEGTRFMELKEILENKLQESIVEQDWLKANKTNYDIEYLQVQSETMDKAYKIVLKLINEYYDILDRINKLINNRNFNQAEKMYVKLKKLLDEIKKNDFYATFILPMNRVHHKLLADSSYGLKRERNPVKKGRKIVNNFRQFMNVCESDINKIQSVYEEMNEKIYVILKD